ncbi:LysR family transcriptional regulator [Mesorhizobium sp. B2-4-9]|uniref:LysR family transcriptional regulator n=1 Tax=Mesorhizobium sp. B2-4-9 TaxID=2589940 RepID=UPI00112637EA|nr:LysR family transcriptional regulator [Mesorhizobium sp. B2-4-9]TPL23463.1 LysR family transcriptional regulator [Mesorhizobium sp. B2-4-9]
MDQLLAIRTFVRIADSGTFARAADALRLPRSSTSKLIADLEDHLGTKLIQRTTRTVSVTSEGAEYYQRAVRLLADVDEMDAVVANSRAQPKGRLRVDIGSSLANFILIPALPVFRRLYPEIEVHLGVSDRPADLINDGVDCVIRGGALADTSLIARRVCDLDFVTCAAPSYLAIHGVPTRPFDLEEGHVLTTYFSSLTGRPFPLSFHKGDEVMEIAGRAMTAVNESTAHLSTLLAGLGIGQTFRHVARPHIEEGRLVAVLEAWSQERLPLHIMYPPNRHLNAKIRVFVDWVASVFAKIGKA